MMKATLGLGQRITFIHLGLKKITNESLKNKLSFKMNCQNKGCPNFERKIVKIVTKHVPKGTKRKVYFINGATAYRLPFYDK